MSWFFKVCFFKSNLYRYASVVANAIRKQKIELQKKFLNIARTRSARYKIQKFLTEQGGAEHKLNSVYPYS